MTVMPGLVKTTARRLVPNRAKGYTQLVRAPGEPETLRADIGGDPSSLVLPRGSVLMRLLHLTDLHVIDAGSPARCDWVEVRADDKKWLPLLHMARPHDLLANWGAAAFANAISASADDRTDLVIFTGDNIDNAQRNELDAFVNLAVGGTFGFPYEGPQRSTWAVDPRSASPLHRTGSGLWPFWLPDGGCADRFSNEFGFPNVPGLVDASWQGIVVDGVSLPWLAALGNHDVMRQGTAFTTPELEEIAMGGWRALGGPPDFDPADPLQSWLNDPAPFSAGEPRFSIPADPLRAAVSGDEFLGALRDCGGAMRAVDGADYVYDTEHVRIVVLETNHPTGHFQGSVGLTQLAWLDERLREAQDRAVVVASHHGSSSLDNTFRDTKNSDRRHAAELESVLLRYGNVVAWLVGHRHLHRIRPIANPQQNLPGIWEITTSATIDWPCQIRSVEIVAGDDGSIGVRTEVLDHDFAEASFDSLEAGSLAAWHREIAFNSSRVDRRSGREGTPGDRNAFLARPAV